MGHRWRRVATAVLLTLMFAGELWGVSRAATTRFPAGVAPVFIVQLESGAITVHTWNQPLVQLEYSAKIHIRHVGAQAVAQRLPAQIMLWSERIRTPNGELALAPEPFLFPNLNQGLHDAIVIHGVGSVVLTVPASTALVVGNVRRGSVLIEGYKNGVFVAHVGMGAVALDNVSGTGAIQVNDGPVSAANSSFIRLRVRTGRGNMRFEDCDSTQIEATSLTGSIMYDNGSFEPGLARFETDLGDVMLGVTGSGVQIGAHSSAGKIFSEGPIRSGVTDRQATIGRGGPVVTATSSSGSVIYYSGALRDHPDLERRFANRLHFAFPFDREPVSLKQKFPHHRHV